MPLRAAVIAGTCVVALSLVALPAFADVAPGMSADPTVQAGPVPTDDASDTTTDDSGDVADDDTSTDDSTDTTAAPVVTLPAEKGKPKQHFADTVFTPKEIAKKGLRVTFTGLTAGKTYQPLREHRSVRR